MTERAKQLLTPITVQALVITQEIINQFGWVANDPNRGGDQYVMGDGRWSPERADYGQVGLWLNPPGPAPFFGLQYDNESGAPGRNVKTPEAEDAGVYLHWVVPEALRHAPQQPDGSLLFPPLPDQWLIVRFARQTDAAHRNTPAAVAAWFIDSSSLADAADSRAASLLVAGSTQHNRQVRMGRVYAVAGTTQGTQLDCTDRSGDARVAGLTALGNSTTGAPTFTARAMDNRNVLSWHDTLADLGDKLPEHLALSYAVFGWHRDPADDPLRRSRAGASKTGGERARAILHHLRWQVAVDPKAPFPPDAGGDAPPELADLDQWTCLYHGMVAAINFWDADVYTGPQLGYPGAPYVSGAGEPPLDAEHEIVVGIGDNTTDALVALLWENGSDSDPALWKVLEALLYRQLPALQRGWNEAPREFMVEQARFVPQHGGFRWTLATAERDRTLKPAGGAAGPGAALVQKLAGLNRAQADYNRLARRVAVLQQDMYAWWWSLARAAKYADDMDGPDPQSIADSLATVGKDLTDSQAALAQAATTLKAAFDAVQAGLGDGRFVLKAQGEPRFWQPADPAIVVRGLGKQDKHRQDGKLVCRIFRPEEPATVSAATLRGHVFWDVGNVAAVQAAVVACRNNAQPGPLLAVAGPVVPLLAEAAVLEQALTELVVGDPDAAGKAWPDRVAGWWATVDWDGTGPDEPADKVTLAFADGVDQTPAALARLVSLWGQQPWSPLHLDWQITFTPQDGEARKVYGRSLMAPVAGDYLAQPIQEVLDLMQEPQTDATRVLGPDVWQALHDHMDAWRAKLEGLEHAGLLGQTLSGFHQAFLGRNVLFPRIAPDRAAPWVSPEPIPDTDIKTDFDDAHLLDRGLLTAPDLLPAGATSSRHQRLTLRTLAPPTWERAADALPFDLLPAGQFHIDTLWIVDDFGQWLELAGGMGADCAVVATPHWQHQNGDPFSTALRPRTAQPARLNFRFTAADDTEIESDLDPNTHPICGWAYFNYIDQALTICDGNGRMLGELALIEAGKEQHITRWVCLAHGQAPETPIEQLTDNAPLRGLVAGLLQPSPSDKVALKDLLELICARLRTIQPGNEAHRFRLAGRPLALVSAQVDLELFGSALRDPSPNGTVRSQPAEGASTGDAGLDGYRAPVQLGYAGLARDGLIGWYAATSGQPDMGQIRLPANLPAQASPSGYVTPGDLQVGFNAAANVVLLMDPRAAVHAAAPIVPGKAVTLPEAFIEAARSQMELSFRVAAALLRRPNPALAPDNPSAGVPTVALPAPLGLAGSWVFRSGASTDDLAVGRPNPHAAFDGSLPLGVEGRLVLKATGDEAGSGH